MSSRVRSHLHFSLALMALEGRIIAADRCSKTSVPWISQLHGMATSSVVSTYLRDLCLIATNGQPDVKSTAEEGTRTCQI